jgi:hypothetical protein
VNRPEWALGAFILITGAAGEPMHEAIAASMLRACLGVLLGGARKAGVLIRRECKRGAGAN